MKSSKAAARKHSSSHHRHHEHHSSSRLEKIFPFLHRYRGDAKTKKGDRSFTVFSIQVTVLGRVLVPTEQQLEQGHQKEIQKLGSDEDLLSPSRTVPAQLNRSETTSYVIHRTFEDFQRLSEMVLRLQHQLDHDLHHHHIQQHNPPQQQQEQQQQHQGTNHGTESQPGLQPLSALRLHHPHPSLVYTFMKQFMFSNAKANQRAFDASSTTHGFDEEGAYERIIELTQFLEEAWRRLLFSSEQETEGGHHYYPEQHDIMLWFKPSTESSHADGRQMRDRQQQQEQDQKRFLLQQETYGRHTVQAKKRVTMEDASAASPTLHTGSDLSSSSASPSSSSGSLPGFSSPSSSSVSSMSISATTGAKVEATNEDEVGHMGSTSSASSPMFEEMDMVAAVYDDDSKKDDLRRRHTVCEGHRRGSQQEENDVDAVMKQDQEAKGDDKVEEMPAFTPRQANRSSTMGHPNHHLNNPQEKIKRRISFSHVFRSLTSSGYQRHGGVGHLHTKSASASTPGSPKLDNPSFDEILIWNTVTSKNTPKAMHV